MEFIKKFNNTQKVILIILIALICGIIAYAVMSNNSEYEEQDILEQNIIENKIENKILGDIAWNKTEETYLQDEKVWQVSYFFEI